MANTRDYFDPDKKSPSFQWFMRQALGAASLVGVGGVAYKMGGPTGRMLDKIKPFFSIIIPTYNRANYIEKTIKEKD